MRRLTILLLLAIAYKSLAVEITVTNRLATSSTEFYSQSSRGQLLTCGIEFKGVDTIGNYFSGTFGFLNNEDGPNPVLKVTSQKILDGGAIQSIKVVSAWISTPSASTLMGVWVTDTETDSILVIGGDIAIGTDIYTEIVTGETAKIGFFNKGESIGRVYELAVFGQEPERSVDCLFEMLSDFVGN